MAVLVQQFDDAAGAKVAALYPQHPVAIFQVEVNAAHREMQKQQPDKHARPVRICHIGFKNLYHRIVHITKVPRCNGIKRV